MTNVHELPDSMERAWRVFSEAVRVGLLGKGECSEREVDAALLVLKPLYLKAAKPKAFSGNGDEVVEALNTWVHDVTATLLIAIAVREIELQRAGAR